MTRIQFTLSAAIFAASTLTTPAAMASEPGDKFEGGKGGDKCDKIKVEDLDFYDLGEKLKVKGKLACLQKKDVDIYVEARGKALVLCKNPGGKFPPGQNPNKVWVETEGDVCIDENELENKCAEFKVVTYEPDVDHVCKDKWTAVLKDVSFVRATITIEQGGYKKKELHCTFPDGTKDGEVKDVDCD